MTVRELIKLLEAMPQDALVIHTLYSDYEETRPEDVILIDGAKNFEQHGTGLARHNGHLMSVHKRWLPEGFTAEFVTAVHL